jgi:nitroimidazol reductase NimA-like FMN-containing flavoprotein (pyridoxamine 5'-phosphate oxidase superfamily)
MSSEPTPGRLLDLSADECWALAASVPIGRLAWTGPHGPSVIPVNFSVDGRQVQIRTTAYSEAARECDDSLVAFEVDTFDPAEHRGWSVLKRARAHLGYDAARDDAGPEPWVAGPRRLCVRVEVSEITGRRIATSA